MNKFTKTLKSLAILVALSIFVGLFVVIFQNFVPGRINSQTEIIPTSNPNISVYPPPEETPSPIPITSFHIQCFANTPANLDTLSNEYRPAWPSLYPNPNR